MKNIITLLTFLIIVSCSSDATVEQQEDSTVEQQENEFPTNITVSSQAAEIGGVLTINGNGFSSNETYIITFAENQDAPIKEITNDYITVEVPENAVSGKITLTYNNETMVIGNIEINHPVETKLFGFNQYPSPYIAELNSENGNEILKLVELPKDNYQYYYFVYLKESNEVIASYNTSSPFTSGYFLIDVTTKEKREVIIPENSSYDLFNVNSRLFGFNQYPSPYIAELNSENGNEILKLTDLPKDNYQYYYFVYLKESNEIIASYNTSSPYTSGYFLINVTTKEKRDVIIPENNSYKLFNVNSRLFGFNQYPSPYIAELNSENGNEILKLVELPKDNYQYYDFLYLEESNEVIAFYNTTSPFTSGYFLIDITTKEKREVIIPENNSYTLFSY